jgi:hypothetical protein
LIYLPSYSLHLNPLEEVFTTIKNLLRQASVRIREALAEAIGVALSAGSAAAGAPSSMPDTVLWVSCYEPCCEGILWPAWTSRPSTCCKGR